MLNIHEIYENKINDFFYNNKPICYSIHESKIDALKTFMVVDNHHHENCSICSEIYQFRTIIKVLTCGHVFHSTCINQWLHAHNTCPLCRQICII